VKDAIKNKMKQLPGSFGNEIAATEDPKQAISTRILIKDCGVYKFGMTAQERRRSSASDKFDFKP